MIDTALTAYQFTLDKAIAEWLEQKRLRTGSHKTYDAYRETMQSLAPAKRREPACRQTERDVRYLVVEVLDFRGISESTAPETVHKRYKQWNK